VTLQTGSLVAATANTECYPCTWYWRSSIYFTSFEQFHSNQFPTPFSVFKRFLHQNSVTIFWHY